MNLPRSKQNFSLLFLGVLLNLIFGSVLSFADEFEDYDYDHVPPAKLIQSNYLASDQDVELVRPEDLTEERIQKAVHFVANQEKLVNQALSASKRLLEHLGNSLEQMGPTEFRKKFISNDPDLGLQERDKDGNETFSSHATRLVREEDGVEEGMILKIVDNKSGLVWLFVDTDKISIDSKALDVYIARQKINAGQNTVPRQRGRDVFRIGMSFSKLENVFSPGSISVEDLQMEMYKRHKFYESGHWKDFWKTNYITPKVPESFIETAFALAVKTGMVVSIHSLLVGMDRYMYHFLPQNYKFDWLLLGLNIVLDSVTGPYNNTLRNIMNGGHTRLERMARRSIIATAFNFTYSILNKGGISHLNILDVDGLTNVLMIFANVALVRIGGDPVSEFIRLRSEMRINTRRIFFVPENDPMLSAAEVKTVAFNMPILKQVKTKIRVTDEEILIPVRGLKKPWKSRLKWQAFEAILVHVPMGLFRVVDQILMGLASTGGAAVATSGLMLFAGKAPLLMAVPAFTYGVMKYAENTDYVGAPRMRNRWESTKNFMASALGAITGFVLGTGNGDGIVQGQSIACANYLEYSIDKNLLSKVTTLFKKMGSISFESQKPDSSN